MPDQLAEHPYEALASPRGAVLDARFLGRHTTMADTSASDLDQQAGEAAEHQDGHVAEW